MKFDSYPRFLKSDVYRQSLVADLEGAPLPGEEGEEDKDLKGRGSFFWKVRKLAENVMISCIVCDSSLAESPFSLLIISVMVRESTYKDFTSSIWCPICYYNYCGRYLMMYLSMIQLYLIRLAGC